MVMNSILNKNSSAAVKQGLVSDETVEIVPQK